MPNIYGFEGFDSFDNYKPVEGRENIVVREPGLSGVMMTGSGLQDGALRYSNNAVLVPEETAPVRAYWYRGGWYDSVTDFWNCFSAGRLEPTGSEDVKHGAIGPAGYPVGSARPCKNHRTRRRGGVPLHPVLVRAQPFQRVV